jgi:hypothetical protein
VWESNPSCKARKSLNYLSGGVQIGNRDRLASLEKIFAAFLIAQLSGDLSISCRRNLFENLIEFFNCGIGEDVPSLGGRFGGFPWRGWLGISFLVGFFRFLAPRLPSQVGLLFCKLVTLFRLLIFIRPFFLDVRKRLGHLPLHRGF